MKPPEKFWGDTSEHLRKFEILHCMRELLDKCVERVKRDQEGGRGSVIIFDAYGVKMSWSAVTDDKCLWLSLTANVTSSNC